MSILAGHVYSQNTITPQWAQSMLAAVAYDQNHDKLLIGQTSYCAGASHVATGRCGIVEEFLTTDAEWLWFTDTDAVFEPDALYRLYDSADSVERPIVGALAFGVRENLDLFPTIYTTIDDGLQIAYDYPRDQLVRCTSTGGHFLLIARTVLEDPRWIDGQPNPWFRMSAHQGHEVSEDHWFCLRARSFGYPVHVNTAVKTGHVKAFVADEQFYLENKEKHHGP